MSFVASAKGTNPAVAIASLSITGSSGVQESSAVANTELDQLIELALVDLTFAVAPTVGERIECWVKFPVDGTTYDESPGEYLGDFVVALAQTAAQTVRLGAARETKAGPAKYRLINESGQTVNGGSLEIFFIAGFE